MTEDDQTTKYRELYVLSKEVLSEEDKRIVDIENKAAKYFSAVSIMFGGFAFFAKSVLNTLAAAPQYLSLFLLFLLLIVFVMLITVSFSLLSVLRYRGYLSRPVDIEFFDKNELPAIYRTLAEKNGEASLKNREQNDTKAQRLKQCHNLLCGALAIFIVIMIVYAVLLIQKERVAGTFNKVKEEYYMVEENSKKSSGGTISNPGTTEQPKPTPTPITQQKPYDEVQKDAEKTATRSKGPSK